MRTADWSRPCRMCTGNDLPTLMNPAILLLPLVAQSLPLDLSANHASSDGSPNRHRLHASRKEAEPKPSPSVRVTIVNATCAPALCLSCSGTNGLPAYPSFPQGEWTSDAPFLNPVADYAVRAPSGELLRAQRITYRPVSRQFLLLTGTLGDEGDPDHLPGVDPAPSLPTEAMVLPGSRGHANLQFRLFPCEGVVKDPCHYRIVNCMPGRTLIIRKPADGSHPPVELAYLTPGNSVLLTAQPDRVLYEIEAGGVASRLEIVQEGAVANCLIPFYLREGKPAHVTVFESP